MDDPYGKFKPADLILRDELAIDRTHLANERTLLSYLRAGVALLLAGATFIHFASSSWFQLVGAGCLPLGLLTLLFGAWRFRAVRTKINKVRGGAGGG